MTAALNPIARAAQRLAGVRAANSRHPELDSGLGATVALNHHRNKTTVGPESSSGRRDSDSGRRDEGSGRRDEEGRQGRDSAQRNKASAATSNQTKNASAFPSTTHPTDQLAAQLKKSLTRKALFASATSLIPLPLIDLAIDAALLASVFNDIHQAFGLTPQQISALDTHKRQRTYTAIQLVGNRVIGTFVTHRVVMHLAKGIGLRLTVQQMSKAVPLAGQIASAAINYATMRHLIRRHIDDCATIAKQVNAG